MANDIQAETTPTKIENLAQPSTRGRTGAFPQVTHPSAIAPTAVSPNDVNAPSIHEDFALRYTLAASTRRYDPTPSKSAYTANDPSPLAIKIAIGILISMILGAAPLLMAFSHTPSVVPTTTSTSVTTLR